MLRVSNHLRFRRPEIISTIYLQQINNSPGQKEEYNFNKFIKLNNAKFRKINSLALIMDKNVEKITFFKNFSRKTFVKKFK